MSILSIKSVLTVFIKVLGDGKVLEFDRPDILLSNANSHFTSLVNQTGMGEADYLRNLVKMK